MENHPQKKPSKEEIEKLVNDNPISIKEAIVQCRDKLGCSETYFKKFVRPKLNLRPIFLDIEGEEPKGGNLKILQSELDLAIFEIKEKFKSRDEIK